MMEHPNAGSPAANFALIALRRILRIVVQSSATTSDAESPFIVTWKCPELQCTRQTDALPLKRSFLMTLAQGWPLARMAAASVPFATSCAAATTNQPNAMAPTATTGSTVRNGRALVPPLVVVEYFMFFLSDVRALRNMQITAPR
jgi:hypothetical protein